MIFEYMEAESTQQEMKELYKAGEARLFDAVTALCQTAGRGRSGRSFYSPEGGLYLSMLLPYDETGVMTRGAGACAVKAIAKTTGKDLRIKPVNDLYMDGRKIAGILAEAVTDDDSIPIAVILGIGINLVTPEGGFPEEIKNRAGALYESASEIGWIGGTRSVLYQDDELSELLLAGLRSQLMYALIKEFGRLADPSESGKLLEEYERLLLSDWPGKGEEDEYGNPLEPAEEDRGASEAEINEGIVAAAEHVDTAEDEQGQVPEV
ncbi:MAG: biotin--[Firmicutes bacterium]|nr:biotin--[acetyl-CoA-carboxylase] ligase [Bacillota bacterium]